MISVVIPTFNRARCLERSVSSVLSQTYKNLELIVIDDGSDDETSAVVAQFGDPRLRYHRIEHGGVSRARNTGIRMSKAAWISFLDSDDWWLPQKLARQWQTLQTHSEYRVIYTNEIWIRNGVRVSQRRKHRKFGGQIYRHCLRLCIISPSSILLHRDLFDSKGVFDESYPVCEDYEMWLRISYDTPIYFLDEPLIVKTGGHSDQLSKSRWGFDRYRVRALVAMAESRPLSHRQRLMTAREIVRKATILFNGFSKRNKIAEARHYETLIHEWTSVLENSN